eukprot:1051880-Pyramimonas_sp.AAC.1
MMRGGVRVQNAEGDEDQRQDDEQGAEDGEDADEDDSEDGLGMGGHEESAGGDFRAAARADARAAVAPRESMGPRSALGARGVRARAHRAAGGAANVCWLAPPRALRLRLFVLLLLILVLLRRRRQRRRRRRRDRRRRGRPRGHDEGVDKAAVRARRNSGSLRPRKSAPWGRARACRAVGRCPSSRPTTTFVGGGGGVHLAAVVAVTGLAPFGWRGAAAADKRAYGDSP